MSNLTNYPPTYWCRTAHTATPTTLNATKILGYIWHPATSTSTLQLLTVGVHGHAGANGSYEIELFRITAENGTPGGTTPAIAKADTDFPDAGCKVVSVPTGAPTLGECFYAHAVEANSESDEEIEPHERAAPFTVNSGAAGGFAVRVTIVDQLTTAADVNANFQWIEIPSGWVD